MQVDAICQAKKTTSLFRFLCSMIRRVYCAPPFSRNDLVRILRYSVLKTEDSQAVLNSPYLIMHVVCIIYLKNNFLFQDYFFVCVNKKPRNIRSVAAFSDNVSETKPIGPNLWIESTLLSSLIFPRSSALQRISLFDPDDVLKENKTMHFSMAFTNFLSHHGVGELFCFKKTTVLRLNSWTRSRQKS
jgi:hypothetical protein